MPNTATSFDSATSPPPPVAPSVAEQIQAIYIGLLGRAADLEGLQYWEAEITTGLLTIEQLRANIVNEQPEYLTGMGTLSRAEVVAQLYQNLFGRAPEAGGLDYWVNGGGSTVNIDQLVLALTDGASAADRRTLEIKQQAAQEYTTAAGTNYDPAAAASAVFYDPMTGGSDDDNISGGADQNVISGGSGDDFLRGGAGDDTLRGGSGDDTLKGGEGDDILEGNSGNDVLFGDAGNDSLTGGSGADHFVFTDDGSFDRVTDFNNDEDVIRLVDFGVASFDELLAAATFTFGGDSTLIEMGDNRLEVNGLVEAEMDASDFDYQVLLDFEDLPNAASALVIYSPTPYQGFVFDPLLVYLNGDTYSVESGYTLMGSQVGLYANRFEGGGPLLIEGAEGQDFTFDSVELTAAWDQNFNVYISGYNDGALIATEHLVLNDYEVTLFDPQWGLIDELVLDVPDGNQVVFDNFLFFA